MPIFSSCRAWICAAALLLAPLACAQALSVHWEELTAGDFVKAIDQAKGVCVLPFGILEKHGPHLPLGTDLINVRYAALHAAAEEYTVVFPEYYFGQIFEARQEPGTIAYSARLQMELLQETVHEMARNGCRKVLIVNGHGGNNSMLPYFAQSQLASPRDYVVYVFGLPDHHDGRPAMTDKLDMHAGQSETSHTMITRPDLVHADRAGSESGAERQHLKLPPNVYTGIWWYAKFPDHYSGDGGAAYKELGEFDVKAWIGDIVEAIRAVKADENAPRLQREFFEKTRHPLDTKQ
jgi:creatinine amidohydrolase